VRVECESCRALVPASFAIEGDTVRATCAICHHVMSMPEASSDASLQARAGARGRAAIEAAIDAPTDAPTDALTDAPTDARGQAPQCPKCGAPCPREATACPTCGLTVARMAGYIEARDAAAPGPVRDAWSRAVAAWGDAARHDQLLQVVVTYNAYAWAAGRYRTAGRDAIALRQLDRLGRAAEATLRASAAARPGAVATPYRATTGVLATFIVVIAVGLWYAMVVRDHPLPSRTRPIPARPLNPEHPVHPSSIR
jgi:hypothetical protein